MNKAEFPRKRGIPLSLKEMFSQPFEDVRYTRWHGVLSVVFIDEDFSQRLNEFYIFIV